jgi:glutamate-5-semialdehyde dehydrogenase
MNTLKQMAIDTKSASFEMKKATTSQKNRTLEKLTKLLKRDKEVILSANRQDSVLAKSKGLSDPLLERLSLENRLEGIIEDILKVIDITDPVGEFYEEQHLKNGLLLSKCCTPIGVLGVIYESRPNVTLDISSLTIKSGNCAILRGGSETLQTNQVLVRIIQEALTSTGLPKNTIQLIANTDREEVKEMLQLHEYIDLIIPRGSSTLQNFCREHSKIPVITGGIGICHLFVDESADLEKCIPVISNAKIQRPTVCNALDTLLVHARIASDFIPKIVDQLSQKGVTFRLDPRSFGLVKNPSCQQAAAFDWDTEWLSLVLGIKIVDHLDEALDHIRRHSSSHSDGILTENKHNAELFIRSVDSAAVYVNASTRFTDGGQFGMGAEVAISTQKLHARGPMGLKELTTYKWIARGDYEVRK